VEEIEDRSKADGFSKTIALGQTLWFVAQCLARIPQHLDLTLVELLTLSLAVLNGVMYFLWWHKSLDVRCPVHVYLLDKPDEPRGTKLQDLDRYVFSRVKSVSSEVSRGISERCRQISIIWQSLPILSKVLISTITIPCLFALTFSFLPILVFVIPALFLIYRWISILATDYFKVDDMEVPTFYSTSKDGDGLAYIFFMSVVGVVFGGIHCIGWYFNFPSSDEAMLWRVSSAVLTGVAFILPLLFYLIMEASTDSSRWLFFITAVLAVIAYVVARLLLLVEAFISLRHLTHGMLALVKWTSFIPYI